MPEVHTHHLPPTALIPNSPRPLLHYPGLLAPSPPSTTCSPPAIHDLFASNAWRTQWIFRYGPTQASHYHSAVHECMVVLSGTATVRFGVADTDTDGSDADSGSESDSPASALFLPARAGDVFLVPAGVAHKTFNAQPAADFKLLTPGNGHHIPPEDIRRGENDGVRTALEGVVLDGFTMLGAYPEGSEEWNFAVGGEDVGAFERVWGVAKPDRDPVLGVRPEGLVGKW